MGTWEQASWQSTVTGLPRRDRRAGVYSRYLPDVLVGTPVVLSPAVDLLVGEAERAVRELQGLTPDLSGISRFLLRSEAIASSRIEGIAPSARQIALAELGQTEDVRGVSEQAQLVANNMTVVREATSRLVEVERVSVEEIVAVHRTLLPDDNQHGLRTVQNWIGGSAWHPLDAEFVPPPAEHVVPLMEDLVAYLAGGTHSALVQAALVHAQFETIHPFTDGNGRVGRALIHTVLGRRGLVRDAVLPVSLVLSTLRDTYVAGLTAYRSGEPPDAPGALAARSEWVRVFAEVTIQACEQARRIAQELAEVRDLWSERLTQHRAARGAQRAPRSDSALAAILAGLPATPVLTPQTVTRIHGVSHVAAGRALDELTDAGILVTKTIAPARRAYLAQDVLDLIGWAERRLASTRFDTRQAPPRAGVPAPPRRP